MSRFVAFAKALPLSGRIGLALVLFWLLVALAGPMLAPHAVGAFVDQDVFSPITAQFPLGSDYLGRDVLSRLLWGARYTVFLGAGAALLACLIGTTLALTAAVQGGWLDEVLSRAMDTLISIPSKIFALVMVAAFGSSLALLLTMLGALWFGSLGAGGWWLVFGLVGALREWPGWGGARHGEPADPIGLGLSALRVLRTVVAGGILAWRLGPL